MLDSQRFMCYISVITKEYKMKHCPACGLNKSFAEFYFYNGKPKSHCKECCKQKANQRIKTKYHSDAAFRQQQIDRATKRNIEKRDELLVYYKDYNANRRKKKLDSKA